MSAAITPTPGPGAGIAARVQDMRCYYTLLAEAGFAWSFGATYNLRLQVVGRRIQGWIDDRPLFDVQDADRPLVGGGVAPVCTEARMATDGVTVRPAG